MNDWCDQTDSIDDCRSLDRRAAVVTTSVVMRWVARGCRTTRTRAEGDSVVVDGAGGVRWRRTGETEIDRLL